jgi:hypothetical protein
MAALSDASTEVQRSLSSDHKGEIVAMVSSLLKDDGCAMVVTFMSERLFFLAGFQ